MAAVAGREPEVTDYQIYAGTAAPYNFNGLVRHYFLRSQPWHADLAVALVECVNALPKATQYMLDEGEPSPYEASYDDPEVRDTYPNADLIRDSIREGGPRPLTPYYVDVAGAVIQTWHPPAAVNSQTPARSDQFMSDVLAGRRLL